MRHPDNVLTFSVTEGPSTLVLPPVRSVLHASENILITSINPRPNWWWRLWYWVLLGWWWEKL